eukprot:scaffold210822_cov22-Tisochrysis_lutea.AAC.2
MSSLSILLQVANLDFSNTETQSRAHCFMIMLPGSILGQSFGGQVISGRNTLLDGSRGPCP